MFELCQYKCSKQVHFSCVHGRAVHLPVCYAFIPYLLLFMHVLYIYETCLVCHDTTRAHLYSQQRPATAQRYAPPFVFSISTTLCVSRIIQNTYIIRREAPAAEIRGHPDRGMEERLVRACVCVCKEKRCVHEETWSKIQLWMSVLSVFMCAYAFYTVCIHT